MVEIVVAGILLGLAAGLAPGPLLTLVITETLQHSVKAGIKVALAPLLTDLPIILVSLFLLDKLGNSNTILGLISIAGAMFVFYIAYETLTNKGVEVNLEERRPKSLAKGMLVNVLSPHPYLFWITVGSPIMTKAFRIGTLSAALFLLGFYALLIGSKVGLALLVSQSKSLLVGNKYIFTMRFLGLALGILAIILLIDGLELLGFIQKS